MSWEIVTQASYDAWEATTDPDRDWELRAAVLAWVLSLQDSGPPVDGIFDPFRETLFARVSETEIWIEYIVLPYLEPPAIVIRNYR